MRRTAQALLLAVTWGMATSGAVAQESGKIPVTQDLRRMERTNERLEDAGMLRRDPTAATRVPVQSDPSGVAGFSGPPGTIGESVGSYSPLPPGAPGNDLNR